jgi:hypothetical protein
MLTFQRPPQPETPTTEPVGTKPQKGDDPNVVVVAGLRLRRGGFVHRWLLGEDDGFDG